MICPDGENDRMIYTHIWLVIFMLLFCWSSLLFYQAKKSAGSTAGNERKSVTCWDFIGSFSTRTISYTMITLHTGVKFIEFIFRESEWPYSFDSEKEETDNGFELALKHLLFLLPLAFLFTTFTALLTFWFRIAKNVTEGFYTTASMRIFFRIFAVANIAVYLGVIILSAMANDISYIKSIRSASNYFIACFYWMIIIGFIFFAVKLYLIIKTIPNLRTNFHVQLDAYRKTLIMFSFMAAVTAFLLLVYSAILIYDATKMMDDGSDERADYPFDPCILSAFRMGETLPPLLLLYILYSFPMTQGHPQSAHRRSNPSDYVTLGDGARPSF